MTATIDGPAITTPRPPTNGDTPAGPIVVRRLTMCTPAGPPRSGPAPLAEPQPDLDPDDPPPAGMRGARVEVGTVLRMALEVLDGRRAAVQLRGRLDEPAWGYLAALAGRLTTNGGRPAPAAGRTPAPALHSLRLYQPAVGVAEASAVWRYRGRHRALAARFEWSTDRWRCTALRLG